MSLSGLSGISAVIIGIITFLVSYNILIPFYEMKDGFIYTNQTKMAVFLYMLIICASSLILTFASVIYFTARKSKKKGLNVWDNTAKRVITNLFIPLITGGIFCFILSYQGLYVLIPGVMLIFYGVGLINASKYTLKDIRNLGLAELLLGLIAAYVPAYGLWFWCAGFGLMNIIYGIYMYYKYDR